jgi:hypothetical protein
VALNKPLSIDDRIVLPLGHVRFAARVLCEHRCPRTEHGVRHLTMCLMPLLDDRDERMGRLHDALGITPDCRDGAHAACPGCPCRCHS